MAVRLRRIISPSNTKPMANISISPKYPSMVGIRPPPASTAVGTMMEIAMGLDSGEKQRDRAEKPAGN